MAPSPPRVRLTARGHSVLPGRDRSNDGGVGRWATLRWPWCLSCHLRKPKPSTMQVPYKHQAQENLLSPRLWAMLPRGCKMHAYWDDASKLLVKIDSPVGCTGDDYPVSRKEDPSCFFFVISRRRIKAEDRPV